MKPSQDFKTRYQRAKLYRNAVRPRIEEVFSFVAPHRQDDFSRKRSTQSEPESDKFTSLPEELANDLAGDLVTFYAPAEAQWAELNLLTPIPKEAQQPVTDLLNEREKIIFGRIAASNFNDIAPQVTFEAGTHGTAAMWVQSPHVSQPAYCEVVPPNELLIAPGQFGKLDRFREQTINCYELPALLDGIDHTLPQGMDEKIRDPSKTCMICWGYWLDWSDPAQPQWLSEITVDGKRITEEKVNIGPMAGACPLLVGRFNPTPGRPWGRGPALRALQDMRVLSSVGGYVLEAAEWQMDPAFKYPDDGQLDMSDGLQRGMGIPVGFQRGDDLGFISPGGSVDVGYFEQDRLEDRVRAAFYQDGPRQRGDTPPSATQWLDERRRVQQRINKPSAPLWSELFFPFFQRVEWMAAEQGHIDQQIAHESNDLDVLPISPLQKALNQDKVMITRSNLELAIAILGEQAQNVIDMPGTLAQVKEASGDELMQLGGSNAPAPTT